MRIDITEHPVDHTSTVMDIAKVLKELKDEARKATEKVAYFALTSPRYREEALYLRAQEDILENLEWALSGTAYRDGCENITVEIQELR